MRKNFKKIALMVFSISLSSVIYAKDIKKGTVVSINYPTKDYTVSEKKLKDSDKYEKHAWVYLPAGYNEKDKNTKYPVFLLMHGNSCNENTWGLQDEYGKVKEFLDKGMASGEVEKFIVVAANGISDKTWAREGQASSLPGVNQFGKEFRNDLLPYLREHFNILDGRENVAMAGFSMGAEQTMNIGIGECLDLISYFGAFSSIPFSIPSNPSSAVKSPSTYIKQVEKKFPDEKQSIKVLYMICGTNDGQFYPGFKTYIAKMPGWKRIEKFEQETIEGGNHDYDVWLKGFEHFIKIIFK